jgi:hypothetical protein
MNSAEANKRLIRRFIEEVVNTGDVSRIDELVSADCEETDGIVRVHSGVSGMAEHIIVEMAKEVLSPRANAAFRRQSYARPAPSRRRA